MDPITEKHELIGHLDTNVQEENFLMENRLSEVLKRISDKVDVKGIAISTAGIVDSKTGEIVYANKNIPNYKGTKLKEILETKYNVPVSVENDVNSALLGEVSFGSFDAVHSALMLTVGTGVGGALYLNEGIYHGFSHSAGEVGYAIINGQNIEELASTTALVKNVKARLKQDKVDGRWIFDQAIHHENEVCITEINHLVKNLVFLISNYVALFNPEVVILGGGIMEQADYLRPLILNAFKEVNTNQLVVENTKIAFASLGNEAGMLGAYSHFKQTVYK